MAANARMVIGCLIGGWCALMLTGCRQDSSPPPTQEQPFTVTVNTAQGQSPSDPAARPEQIETAIHSDACASRLQEIGGALLEFYAIHNRLPTTLAELNSLPDLDQPLVFACPGSDKGFVYVSTGLISPTDPRQIVLYDPAVDRAGLRWVIRLRRPHGREAFATFVEHMPQSVFQTFTPIAR